MINYTKKYINIVSLIISIIIFCFINSSVIAIPKIDFNQIFLSNQSPKNIVQIGNIQSSIRNETSNSSSLEQNNKTNDKQQNSTKEKNSKAENKSSKNPKITWTIEIPKINLKAEIAEGTTKEVMDAYVGHFEETQKEKGNIGLAAHNRGYAVNYFQNLKKLKEGDEIIYNYNGAKKTYVVKTLKIIKDTDWTYLENTKENKITLITCVENEPEYRRCIQGVEK